MYPTQVYNGRETLNEGKSRLLFKFIAIRITLT